MMLKDVLKPNMRVGIDTAPLIYLAEKHPTYFKRMVFIMNAIAIGHISAVSTMLTLTEVLTYPLRIGDKVLIQKYQTILSNSVGFDLIPLSKSIAYKAAELRAKYTLKTPDAIQIATAIQTNCHAFLTNDKGLKRIIELQIWILDDLML